MMKKIKITNYKTGQQYYGFEHKFANYEALIDWKNQEVSNNSWGKPEREIVALYEAYDESDILSTREVEIQPAGIDELGEIIYPAVTQTLVTLKAEYIIEIEDITAEHQLQQLRLVRDQRLFETDKYMLVDFPISEEEKALYIQYRAYLRGLPEVLPTPESVLTFEQWKLI